MQQTDKIQKRYAVYCRVITAGLFITLITFLPYLADYYLLQPADTVLAYFAENSVDRYYEFETVIVFLSVVSIWCISGSTGAAISVPSALFLLLSYADSIKYASLNELFRLSDLKLTEAAGIATRYLNLKFTPAQIMVIITILFFCAGGFVSDKFCRKYPLYKKQSGKYSKRFHAIRIFFGFVCLAVMFRYGNHLNQGFLSEGFSRSLTLLAAERLRSSSKAA